MKQGTQSWCTGTTLRDGKGRELQAVVQDGGIHVHPWLIHVNVWQKPLQYCKVISLLLKLNKLIFLKAQSDILFVALGYVLPGEHRKTIYLHSISILNLETGN